MALTGATSTTIASSRADCPMTLDQANIQPRPAGCTLPNCPMLGLNSNVNLQQPPQVPGAGLMAGGESGPPGWPQFLCPTATSVVLGPGDSRPNISSNVSLPLSILPDMSEVLVSRPVLAPSTASPLGLHVPQAVRERICQGLFVDFALLYNDAASAVVAKLHEQQSSNFTVAVEGGNLVLKRLGAQRRRIETFDMWQSAFHVFMSIFISKHPSRCAELLKYAEIIRTASIQFPGLGWKAYDEQFRLRQEANPNRSWGEIDYELWLTVAAASVTSPVMRSTNHSYQSVLKPRTRPGLCFAYNSATGCTYAKCRFAHTCQKCMRAGHGAPHCRTAGQARWANPTQGTSGVGLGAASHQQFSRSSSAAGGQCGRNIQLGLDLCQEAPLPSLCKPQAREIRISLFVLPTPIKVAVLLDLLVEYPQLQDADILRKGFTEGFSLGYKGPRLPRDSQCLASAAARPDIVHHKLASEIALGRIAGPFAECPFTNLQCSPIGLIPKRDPNSFRLIQHLSFPVDNTINDFIDRDLCAVHYASFDNAVALALSAGEGAWLAKADIKSAFRLLPICPDDYELLGFSFQGMFYYDRCLPMGCSVSCALFEKFSTFLEHYVKRMAGTSLVTHYLDDFLFVGPSPATCLQLLTCFQSLCSTLGVPLAPEKTVGPAQVLTYLGLDINTVDRTVCIPADKVQATSRLIEQALDKQKISLQNIQSIVGSLNFLCRAIPSGRAFLRRLITLASGLSRSHHRVRISKGARLDLITWCEFLTHFNGVTIFPEAAWESDDSLSLFTDAAASIGYGAYFRGQWVQGPWPPEFIGDHPSIAFLELLPLYVALQCWAPQLAGRKVIFHTDNIAVVHIINKKSSQCDRIMQLVRPLVLQCLRFNISFKAVHVPGRFNDIADALSRFQMDRFRRAAPQAAPAMTPLPPFPLVR